MAAPSTILVLFAGCGISGRIDGFSANNGETAVRADAAAWYERWSAEATRTYQHAILWMPRDGAPAGLEADFAPLIVEELSMADDNSEHVSVSHVGRDAGGRTPISRSNLVVYATADRSPIDGVDYDVLTYIWFYPPPDERDVAGPMRPVGIRMTLARDGFPAVWEVLERTASGAGEKRRAARIRRLFVSASFERNACAQFGTPLPGRRFCAERSLSETPGSIVVRVIEDGPVPLGPYVYVNASDRTVSSVLCRCSPAQLEEVSESDYYDMRPIESLGTRAEDLFANRQPPDALLRWPLED